MSVEMMLKRYVFLMGLASVCVVALGVILSSSLLDIMYQNISLNAVIVALIVSGAVLAFYNIFRLGSELKWLLAAEKGYQERVPKPHILRALMLLLKEARCNGLLTPVAARSILSSVEERLEVTHDMLRYLTGLLVFLGLLGTFWGLSKTIGSIAGLLNSLNLDNPRTFSIIRESLQGPLAGMGTAFSCSMLGLAGSLFIGCLDLIYRKATQSFYHHVEERVTHATRIGLRDEAASSGAAYTHSLLEQVVELTYQLHQQIRHGEESRSMLMKSITQLADQTEAMSQNVNTHQDITHKIAQSQLDLQNHVMRVLQSATQKEQVAILQKLVTQTDVLCEKILEEVSDGRRKMCSDITNEIRLVSRTLSALVHSAA